MSMVVGGICDTSGGGVSPFALIGAIAAAATAAARGEIAPFE